jgi:transposase
MEPGLVALQGQSVAREGKLYVSLELSDKSWRVAASDGARVSEYTVSAGDGAKLLEVLERARRRFGLGPRAVVVSCYEAGRDGFWLHRFLSSRGVRNHIVDAASIEVNRRARRAKTDRLDARALLGLLMRYESGERRVWSVLRVPSEQAEDERRVYRERERLIKERGAHRARMQSLLLLHNLRRVDVRSAGLGERLAGLGVAPCLRAELEREAERLALVERQLALIAAKPRCAEVPAAEQHRDELPSAAAAKSRALERLRAVGPIGAEVLVREVFGWRRFANRRELAASVGIVPTPYSSGESSHEQGISKAGNRRVRSLMVELAWAWLRYQPESALARWYARRFAHGGARLRRIGIVALARRLLIALWHYLEHGLIPEAAKLKAQ